MKILRFGSHGKRIAIVGSLHGNEKIGKKVIEELSRIKGINARITAVIANEGAIKANKRYLDVDGNRCFPGSINGNREQRLARSLLMVISQCDYVIDIHSTYADMEDTAIITKKGSFGFAQMAPISKVIMMGPAIAHGKSLIDYSKIGLSIEFNRKRSTEHVAGIVLSIIENLNANRRSQKKKQLFIVNGFVKDNEKKLKLHNFKRTVIDGETVYPIFYGERGYKGALCMTADKVNSF